MAQIIYSETGAAIVFPIRLNPNGAFPIVECVVTNGTGATLTIKDQAGVLLAVALPYLPIDFVCGQSQQLVVTSNGVAILATDVLLIQAFGSPSGLSVPSSYGPSIFAGGAVPNSLQNVIGGQAIAAWMVQQIINLLTGVMTGQSIKLANFLELAGSVAAIQLDDRDGIGADNFILLLNGGVLRFNSSVAAADLLTLNETGQLTVQGANANLQFNDRAGGAHNFLWYSSGSLARLFGTGPSSDLVTVSEAGNVVAQGSLTADQAILANGLNVAGGSRSILLGSAITDALSFYGHATHSQTTVTGSRGGNVALGNLLSALHNVGLIVDGSTP